MTKSFRRVNRRILRSASLTNRRFSHALNKKIRTIFFRFRRIKDRARNNRQNTRFVASIKRGSFLRGTYFLRLVGLLIRHVDRHVRKLLRRAGLVLAVRNGTRVRVTKNRYFQNHYRSFGQTRSTAGRRPSCCTRRSKRRHASNRRARLGLHRKLLLRHMQVGNRRFRITNRTGIRCNTRRHYKHPTTQRTKVAKGFSQLVRRTIVRIKNRKQASIVEGRALVTKFNKCKSSNAQINVAAPRVRACRIKKPLKLRQKHRIVSRLLSLRYNKSVNHIRANLNLLRRI